MICTHCKYEISAAQGGNAAKYPNIQGGFMLEVAVSCQKISNYLWTQIAAFQKEINKQINKQKN